jgi:uncharacterized protein involved in exopolysaccharide biosynthesis
MTSDRTLIVQPRNSDRHSDLDELDTFPTTRVLWRRKTLIICTTIALTMIMTAIILQLTPSFSATSYIMIEDGNTEIVDAVEAVMVGGSADSATVESELRVLKSRMLADRAVTELELDKDPEFNSSLKSPGFFNRYLAQVKAVFGWVVSMGQQPAGRTAGEDLHLPAELLHSDPVGAERSALDVKEWTEETLGGGEDEVSSDPALLATARTNIVDGFLSHLSVSVDGLSRVIAVTFHSENPKTAANAANTLADLYIVSKLERKFEAAKTPIGGSTNGSLNFAIRSRRQRTLSKSIERKTI